MEQGIGQGLSWAKRTYTSAKCKLLYHISDETQTFWPSIPGRHVTRTGAALSDRGQLVSHGARALIGLVMAACRRQEEA